MKFVTIDGRQLSYPGTGLSLVTTEFLQAWQKLGYSQHIGVIVDRDYQPQTSNLEGLDVQWLKVDPRPFYPSFLQTLAKAATIPDRVERIAWAIAVNQKLKQLNYPFQHFIPYLYNYGNLQQNIVLIPDLIYRFVNEDILDPQRPWWWNLRHKLPIKSSFRRWEERQVAQAKQLVVYSPFVQRCVTEYLGRPSEDVSLIPLATPSWTQGHFEAETATKLRETYQIPKKFVLYVGGFGPRKNIPLLLRACGQAYQQDNSFCCVFVGLTDSLIQSIFGSEIRLALQSPEVQAASLFLPSLSNEDLALLYRLALFTVYPSLSEGFGLPILEAAAAAKLCLCGDNSSMPDVQLNQQYRLSSEDEKAWTEAMLYYWQNPEIAQQAGQDCAKITQNYNWQESAQQLWELLQQ